MGYINLGTERSFASTPTLDTERENPIQTSKKWTPSFIDIFNHKINIDLTTGNLLISTTDIAYPFYKFSLGITRKYDLQEQFMQLSYMENFPNVNPKPHWFSNWQFAYEADIDEIWLKTFSELHITSGIGANGFFEIDYPNFKRNFKERTDIEKLLKTYGVPQNTLSNLNWTFSKHDFCLRTKRGNFQIITGHFQPETLVDDIQMNVWLFNPITGSAFYIGSDYFYNKRGDSIREIGYQMLVTKLIDSLGHKIILTPVTNDPPFKKFILSDDSTLQDNSNRRFSIELNRSIFYPDGLNPQGQVAKNIVSKVTDHSKHNYNEYLYSYTENHLLEQITFPSSIDTHKTKYHYTNNDFPGVLTAIENYDGKVIEFEYFEDPFDNDERLNPRLKVKKILVPDGIVFEYHYNANNNELIVQISKQGFPEFDREIIYQYIKDANTKQRFMVSNEVMVKKCYEVNDGGGLSERSPQNPQIIKTQTEYTHDGRYNVYRKIDPHNRVLKFEYNDINQVVKVWDFDNHETEYFYDNPIDPSENDPMQYDVLEERMKNLIRFVDPLTASGFREDEQIVTKKFIYKKYNNRSSVSPLEDGIHSTHRILSEEDERNQIWTYEYDDLGSNKPLLPTFAQSPKGFKTTTAYNNRGERVLLTDDQGNNHVYEFTPQGQAEKYINPNNEEVKMTYYPCGNWLHTFEDQLSLVSTIVRYPDGKISKITDPKGDSIDYEYHSNDRLKIIKRHRLAIRFNASDAATTLDFDDLNTEFTYTPMGLISSLKNPKGLILKIEYDEIRRIKHWFHDVANPKKMRYCYDKIGQVIQLENLAGQTIRYSYTNMGFLESISYPPWHNGIGTQSGKRIRYRFYDYLGRCFTMSDNELGDYEFIYDKMGNITYRRNPEGFELVLTHDEDNRLEYVENITKDFVLDIKLDSLGHIDTLTDGDKWDPSITWKYKYEKTNGIMKVLNLYEIENASIDLKSSYDFDEKDRIISLTYEWTKPPRKSELKRTFHYRIDDLLGEIREFEPNLFNYDGVKQLIYEDAGKIIFDYDQAGNRLFKIPLIEYAHRNINEYNELNQLEHEKILNAKIKYDDNENIRKIEFIGDSDKNQEFYFDGFNKLRLYKSKNVEINYLYNVDGQIFKITVKDLTQTPPKIDEYTINYLFSKPILINQNNALEMLLTWDLNGKLLRAQRNNNIGGINFPKSLFALYDGLGNIVSLVDSDRNEKRHITYNSWGEEVHSNDDYLFGLLGYKGGISDIHSGNVLFGVRWYIPVLGRFFSYDPIDLIKYANNFRTYLNLYSYTYNNPISLYDPAGLNPVPQYNPMPESQLLEPPYCQITNLPAYRPERLKMLGFELVKGKFSRHQIWAHPSGHTVYYWSNPETKSGITPNEKKFGLLVHEEKSQYDATLRYYEDGTIERYWIKSGHSQYFRQELEGDLWNMVDPDSGKALMEEGSVVK